MRLKTFHAPTISEAMQLVRASLGDDAIIVSTESKRGQRAARVVAAIEDPPPQPNPVAAPASADPMSERSPIERSLAFHGVPPGLAAALGEVAGEFADEGPSLALSAALDGIVAFQPLSERLQQRPILLFGPPGAGKTLTAAKLLLRACQSHRPALAISTDTERAGGIEQLEAFTRLLNVPLGTASTPDVLADHVARAAERFVVIDTPGANLFDDADLDALADLATAADAEPIAVFAAGGDAVEAPEMAERAATIGCRRMVVTRIDIARRLGALITMAESSGLALAEVGVSPQVAGGLTALNPVSLARLLLPDTAPATSPSVGRKRP